VRSILLSLASAGLAVLASVSCQDSRSGASSAIRYENLTADYMEEWKDFYPARAAALGLDEYRGREDNRSEARIGRWVSFNDSALARIGSAPGSLPLDLRIDLRLIRNQARSELARWSEDAEGGRGDRTFPLGREAFARELQLYYDMEITPEEVAERALREIQEVRRIMAETGAGYWEETRGQEPAPENERDLVLWALAQMEENRPSTQMESLELFTRYADEAEAFVREKQLATLPPNRTLEIVLTPASAGPAQRIGFVDSAPPFDSTGVTVLSLPTIEDSLPEAEKEDFYRSFNNHFNKAIIIHELFPGHYMQQKIASRNPRKARIFFPYEPYIEGWATLVERIALDAGWDDHNRLTYLAHLRKRLENANRAYTSVQVHCFDWTEEQVLRFSEEESLVAPQFAKSLWGRLERGPMQMTSYFMGADRFTRILEAERERLGEDFEIRAFNDAILQAGPIPFDLIPEVLAGR